jgi:WD repeat-containing protein 23
VTSLDSRDDARHFVSNCQDQTMKLWDVRAMATRADARARLRARPLPVWNWDYRYMRYPERGWHFRHPDDVSLQTYRGHRVEMTLIRAYFSPAATTGQRYVYAGGAGGKVLVWDVLTGEIVSDKGVVSDNNNVSEESDGRRRGARTIRDCSWHPTLPLLASVNFAGEVRTTRSLMVGGGAEDDDDGGR